ncbi:MAG: metal-dependent hydrolase [Anaerolinea sp.]|nr:metal-dependent hydrolase [Anaerolinea sp.]
MQTPSHFLLTAVLARSTTHPFIQPIHKPALLIGSVLPDIPFTLLTAAYGIYFRWFASPPIGGSLMEYLHFDLFYTDPVWIIGHNFFHSLVINAALLGLGLWGVRRWRWARPLLWLGIGMLFHTLIDVFTHHSDGPLLFFPLNWTYRFPSPVSYWEQDYYGRQFTVFEYALNAAIIAYFVWLWFKKTSKTHDTSERVS